MTTNSFVPYRIIRSFDPHRIIRELAEAEWIRKSLPDFADDPPGSVGTQSMEVPFESLRIRGTFTPRGSWIPEPDVEKAAWRVHIAHPYTCSSTSAEEELCLAAAWLTLKREAQHDN